MTDDLWTKETPVRLLHRWGGDTKKTQFLSRCVALQIIGYTFLIKKTGCFLWWWQKFKSLLPFYSFSAEMDVGKSSQNGAEMPEEQLSILTCPAVVEFQCALYPKGLFTRGALVPVLTVHLRITNRKSQVISDREILNLKHLLCFLSFPIFIPSRGHLTTQWCKMLMLYHPSCHVPTSEL